jgi:hypothetical protein
MEGQEGVAHFPILTMNTGKISSISQSSKGI